VGVVPEKVKSEADRGVHEHQSLGHTRSTPMLHRSSAARPLSGWISIWRCVGQERILGDFFWTAEASLCNHKHDWDPAEGERLFPNINKGSSSGALKLGVPAL